MPPVFSQKALKNKEHILEVDVLIIGGGVTGAGIMRDLALRGIQSLLIDKKDLCGNGDRM